MNSSKYLHDVIKIQSIVRAFLKRRIYKTVISNYRLICAEIQTFICVSIDNSVKYELDNFGR